MEIKTQRTFPYELLQKILNQTLDPNLSAVEEKVKQKITDLKYLKNSSQQILTKLSFYSSFMTKQTKLRPKIIVIKKNANSNNAQLASPAHTTLNQTSRILNAKTRLTIKPTKTSISHDKVNPHFQKKKSTTNFTEYSLTRAPTMKSYTPDQKRMDKSTSNKHFISNIKGNAKLINKTNRSSQSNTSTPGTTPKRIIKQNETRQINKKKLLTSKNKENKIDDMFLPQDKFNLNDIRFSKIPFLTNNLSIKTDQINHMHSLLANESINNGLPLGEQLETNWDSIGKYISTKDLLGLTLINKQLGVNTINEAITRIEKEIAQLDEQISKVKLSPLMNSSPFESNPNLNNTLQSKPYEFNLTTQRAINLLNESNMDKIFINTSKTSLPCDDILAIYLLYFTIIQSNVLLINFQANKELFWQETCNYFKKRSINKLGLFIENEIKAAKITNEILYILDLFVMKNQNNRKLSPTYYQNMCNVTGIFVFVIKDVMDHFGIGIGKDYSNDNNLLIKILSVRLEFKNKILKKLNNINGKYLN